MKKIKILVAIDCAVGRKGPHRNLVCRLNALTARSDAEVFLLTGEVDPFEPYFKRLSYLILGFNPHSLTNIAQNIYKFKKAAKKCDIIYVSSGLKAFLYSQMFRRGRKLVAGPNVSGLPPRIRNPYPFMIHRMCDGWIEASQFKKSLASRGVDPDYITVIPNAVDINFFTPQKKEADIWEKYDIDPARKKVLFISSDVSRPVKGAKYVLEAFKKYGTNWKDTDLILIGKDSKGLLRNWLPSNNIYHLGPIYGEELAKIYASSDILLITSMSENCPNVVLEAMASGIVVIANAVGGIIELIENNVSGIMVELCEEKRFCRKVTNDILDRLYKTEAIDILASALDDLLKDDFKRTALGKSARQRILNHHTEAHLGQKLMKLFNAVLEGNDR